MELAAHSQAGRVEFEGAVHDDYIGIGCHPNVSGMQVFGNHRIGIIPDDMIWFLNQHPKAQASHIKADFVLRHQVRQTEESLFHQNYKVVLLVSAETFHFQCSGGAERVLDDNPVEKTDQVVVLPCPANLVDVGVPFGKYLRLPAETVEPVSALLEKILWMRMPTALTPSPVFQVGFLIHCSFYF